MTTAGDTTNPPGDRAGTSLAVCFVLGAIAVLFKFWLVYDQRLSAYAAGAKYDDVLFIRLAESILNGHWLGPYNYLTLIKGPGYPLWIALGYKLGLPLLIGQHLYYLVACLLLVWAIRPAIPSRNVALLVFLLLWFCPSTYDSNTYRVTRDSVYATTVLIAHACMFAVLLWRRRSGRALAVWFALMGLALGYSFITREEGIWLAPSIGVFIALALLNLWKATSHERISWLKASLLAPALTTLVVGSVVLLNYRNYGLLGIVEQNSAPFKRAYGALVRVTPDKWKPDVVVPSDVRRRIYKVSPAFAELKSYLDGPVARNWVNNDPQPDPDGEIRTGRFLWAFRDAVRGAGHCKTLADAMTYYNKLANEVNSACDRGELPCGPKRATLMSPWRWEYLRLCAPWIVKETKLLVLFQQTFFFPATSVGNSDQLEPFRRLTRTPLGPSPTSTSRLPIAGKQFNYKVHILANLARLYKTMGPLGAILVVLSFVWAIVSAARRRRVRPIFMFCAIILAAIFSRILLLSYVQVAMFPALYSTYMAPAYPLFVLLCILATYGSAQEVWSGDATNMQKRRMGLPMLPRWGIQHGIEGVDVAPDLTAKTKTSALRAWAIGTCALLPFAILVAVVCLYGYSFPYSYQWWFASVIQHSYQERLPLDALMRGYQGNRFFVPWLIMLPIARLTHWNHSWELAANLVTGVGIFLVFLLQLTSTARQLQRRTPYWMIPLLSFFLFSLVQRANWQYGGGFPLFLCSLASVSGIVLMASALPPWPRLGGSLLLGLLATFSFGAGQAYWIAGLVMLCVTPLADKRYRSTHIGLWLATTAVVLSLFHPSRPLDVTAAHSTWVNPLTYSRWALTYLGSPIGGSVPSPAAAQLVGAFGAMLFLLLIAYLALVRRISARIMGPYIAVGVYALGSAAMAASRHADLGFKQALNSAYTSGSILFWVSLLLLFYIAMQPKIIETPRAHRRRAGAVISMIAIITVSLACASYRETRRGVMEYRKLSAACAAFLSGDTSDSVIAPLAGEPATVLVNARILLRHSLSLFRAKHTLTEPMLDQAIDKLQARYIARADHLLDRKKFFEFLFVLGKAEKLNPKSPRLAEPHVRLGQTFVTVGKLSDAAAQFTEALRLDPGYGPARNELAAIQPRLNH